MGVMTHHKMGIPLMKKRKENEILKTWILKTMGGMTLLLITPLVL
jgi:hypothetical protein